MAKHDRFSRTAKELARSADIPLSVAKRILEKGLDERPAADTRETHTVADTRSFPAPGSDELSRLLDLALSGIFRIGRDHSGGWVEWNLAESPNAAVVGLSGGGKTTLVNVVATLAAHLPSHYSVHLATRLESEVPPPVKNAVHFTASPNSVEEITTMVRSVLDIVKDRHARLADMGMGTFEELQKAHGGDERFKRVLLAADDVLALLDPMMPNYYSLSFSERVGHREQVRDALTEIAKTGPTVGVHLLMTSQLTGEDSFPSGILDSCQYMLSVGRLDTRSTRDLIPDAPSGSYVQNDPGNGYTLSGTPRTFEVFRMQTAKNSTSQKALQ